MSSYRTIICQACSKPHRTKAHKTLFCSIRCAKWRGGRRLTYGNGQKNAGPYWMVFTGKNGRKTGHYTAEHILIAEKVLGRKLNRGEVVHHINGDTTDNSNSNLMICSNSFHKWIHARMSNLYQREHFGRDCQPI